MGSNCATGQSLCFHNINRTIPLLSKSVITSHLSAPVAVQPGLCWTWVETPKTGFLTSRAQGSFIIDLRPFNVEEIFSNYNEKEELIF